MATDGFCDCVEKCATAYAVWTGDLKGFDFDFVARGMLVGTLRHLVFVEIIFLHQPIGEAQCGFSLSLWRIGVIGSLKNRADFFSAAVGVFFPASFAFLSRYAFFADSLGESAALPRS